ncbi:MAG: sodium/calcium exchanger 1, partial [Planctomycetaceae bacterium]|nr:sodium/calcium exchanger 1 [Planctomycetaceae bacterium]
MLFTSWLQGLFGLNQKISRRTRTVANRRTIHGMPSSSRSTVERLEDRALLTTAWVSQGPAIVLGGQSEGITNTPVDGAVHAVAADSTNADILYVGSANGGIWKTTNATSASPTWTPLTDNQSSLSIGALEFDPTDATRQTLVAGLAQISSFSNIGGPRNGLLRTTNGGTSWTAIDGGGTLVGKNISGLAARGNTLIVSVNTADAFSTANTGIFRSTDGGLSFTRISTGNGSTTGLPEGASFDLVGDPNNSAVLYTNLVYANSNGLGGSNGIYKSIDTGATWTKISSPAMDALIVDNTTNNIELATSHAGGTDNVFVGIVQTSRLAALFRSGNGGTSFTQLDTPTTNANGIPQGVNPEAEDAAEEGPVDGTPGSQGDSHFSIVADPTNANVVYVGGDRQPDGTEEGGAAQFPNSIGANNYTGRLFRVNAGLAAGSQATVLTHVNTASNSAPHADSRDMVFDAAGNIIEVDDGGVYRRTTPALNTGDWFSVIGTLGVAEEHDVAYDAVSHTIIAGNQDNGVSMQSVSGGTTWQSVATGDGGDVAVDDTTVPGMSTRYYSTQNLGGFTRDVYNVANVLQSSVTPALTVTGGGAALVPQFVTPTVLNAVTPTRVLLVGKNAAYESMDQGATLTEIPDGGIDVGTGGNAVAYGQPSNPNVIYLGVGANLMVRTALGGSLVATATAVPGGGDDIRDVVLDKTTATANTVFVVDQNQVLETINGGTSWIDVTGNLAALGASAFRTLEFVTGATGNAIVVGTGTGVYYATSANFSAWAKLGTSLPNAPVFDLDYDATDKVLVAGTLGRGAYTMPNVVNEMGLGPKATVSIVKVNDGAEPATNGKFRVMQTAPSATDTVVTYSIPGTETSMDGTDYTTLTGTVTIPAGSTTADIDIDVLDDSLVEATETVIVTLTGFDAHDADVILDTDTGNLTSTLDIADNDSATVSITKINDAAEPATNGKFRVTQTAISSTDTVVAYAVTGTATPGVGQDYTTLTGTVTIPAGSTTADIDVSTLDDAIVEPGETVIVTLTGFVSEDPQVTLDASSVNLTSSLSIADDDTATVSISKILDGAEPGTNGLFRVAQTAVSSTDTVITYQVTGTATPGSGKDYTTLTGTVTIPAGSTTADIDVNVLDDVIVEAAETVTITLLGFDAHDPQVTLDSNAANLTATLSITDDDSATVSIATILDGAEPTTNGKFRVTQTAVSSTDTVVTYSVAGTATPGNDYTILTGTVTIPAGSTTADIDVAVLDDTLIEATETVVLTLTGFNAHDPQVTLDANAANLTST